MTITISSQRYLDDEIIAEKIAHQDFEVAVSPAFEFEGVAYRVVIDGHHSLAAAVNAGIEPEFVEYGTTDDDRIGMIERGAIGEYLELVRWSGDSDFYDIVTGRDIW